MSKKREPTIRETYLAECVVVQAAAIRNASYKLTGTYGSVEATLAVAASILAGRLAGGEDV